MIKRLRPAYTEEELNELYAVPHDHSIFPDHVLRVQDTVSLALELIDSTCLYAADLSCGDAYILDQLPIHVKIYGDYAPRYDFVGPIDTTIKQIPSVDLFICCETLEHLDDPMATLKAIREKTRKLIVSTPLGEFDDGNPEHYWGWDKDGMRKLLLKSGFHPVLYRETRPPMGYVFQHWGCN